MKKVIVCLLCFCGLWATAQPNGGFENWTQEFSYEVPDHWQTLNFLSLSSPSADISAFKGIGIDKHSGNYALKLKSVLINSGLFPEMLGDTLGGAFTGKINFSPFFYKFGYPYHGRPEKLQFWAKYTPVGNDTAVAAVMLRSWNGVVNDTIAAALMSIPPSPVYTLFELTLDYRNDFLPDSAIIAFYPSKDSSTARLNSTLYIDDVSFAGWVGMDEAKQKQRIVYVFPNPAKNSITFSNIDITAGCISIMDIRGSMVLKETISGDKTTLDTSALTNGVYIYEVSGAKNNLLHRGRFSVTK